MFRRQGSQVYNSLKLAQDLAENALGSDGKIRYDWPRVEKHFQWVQIPTIWVEQMLGVLLGKDKLKIS